MINFTIKQNRSHSKGAALLIFILFFLAVSLTLTLTIGKGVADDYAKYHSLYSGKESYLASDGGIEDAIYRHRAGKNYSNSETFTIGNSSVVMTRTTNGDSYEIVAESTTLGSVKRGEVVLEIGDGASFNFGLQSGNGGIRFNNSSSVTGNIFSNGSVVGSGNTVYGDIVSTGALGLVNSMHATGSVWAHTINNSNVDKDAYYTTKTATVVLGTSYPGSPDETPVPLPIDDAKIEEWKTNIVDTGTLIASTSANCSTGTYTIDTNTTLNNVKIECNVIFKKQGASTVITIAGPVWIEGNLSFTSGPSVVASSSLGNKSVQIIVDKVSDRLAGSKVTVNNSTTFTSGSPKSFVFIVSMNNSAELGGVVKAIDLGQTTTGKVLVYAPHGLIEIGQSSSLKEVTAYKINLINSANVIYESGLVNLLFTAGPGGGYTVTSWKEI